MKFPRPVSARLAAVLALGGALLAFAAAPTAARAQVNVVRLDAAALDKLRKFNEIVRADPAAKAAIDEMGKDTSLAATLMSGDSLNDTVNTKYPKVAALFKSAGYTPDEFYAVAMSLAIAADGKTEFTSDETVAKANIDFYKANKEKIAAMMAGAK